VEIIDYSVLSDESAKQVFRNAKPCAICGSKDNLAISIVTTGVAAGRLLLHCFHCQFDPTEDSVKE
jgi:hypothetical protein